MQTTTTTTPAAAAADTTTGETIAPVTVAPAAKPARKPRSKAAAKPVADAKAAKRAKASKPAKPARDNSERQALIGKLRTTVKAVYNGPSLTVRGTDRVISGNAYETLFAEPKHSTTRDRITDRDRSALRMLAANGGNVPAGFDPAALNLDRGTFSRLCSVGFIESAPNGRFRFTSDGRAHAKRVTLAKAA